MALSLVAIRSSREATSRTPSAVCNGSPTRPKPMLPKKDSFTTPEPVIIKTASVSTLSWIMLPSETKGSALCNASLSRGAARKKQNRATHDDRGREQPPCLRKTQRIIAPPATTAARVPAARQEVCQAAAQSISAWNDLRGGSSEISPAPAERNRPRQSSHDGALIQPGCARSITLRSSSAL